MPEAGDSVYLNGNWTVKLDVNPPALDDLIIDGTLFADDTMDVLIEANWIHIRAGNLTAGSSSSPFQHNFTIKVNGQKTDNGFVVDPILAGSKLFVVSGILNLHGIAPSTTTSFLKQTALSGSTTIHVNSKTGWAVGDSIVLAPSFSSHS